MDVSMGKSNMNAGFSPAMFDYRRVCHIWIHLPAILGFSRGTSKVSSPHAPHTHFLWLKMGPDCILRDAHFSSGKWWSTMINPPFFFGYPIFRQTLVQVAQAQSTAGFLWISHDEGLLMDASRHTRMMFSSWQLCSYKTWYPSCPADKADFVDHMISIYLPVIWVCRVSGVVITPSCNRRNMTPKPCRDLTSTQKPWHWLVWNRIQYPWISCVIIIFPFLDCYFGGYHHFPFLRLLFWRVYPYTRHTQESYCWLYIYPMIIIIIVI